MPRYEYECKKCFYRFTTWHSIKDRLSDCPECGEKKILRKIIGIPITIKEKTSGKIVKSYIENVKRELDIEKKEMREEEYKK